ncbi:MAG TPA: PLP-dependent aminotransferase family protein [Ruminococcaceae bacterium]|nr:PLP-dependent aminotransferase family protein [Oscillospiraceae bacterium]
MEYRFANRVDHLKPSVIREILKFTGMPGIVPFAAGNPAPEAFPVEEVTRISGKIFAETPIDALQYSISEGDPALRETMRGFMRGRYGAFREFDELIITAGAQQVMELTVKALCDEGDTLICENPSFIGSLNAFRSYKLNLVGIEMESDGISLEKLEQALKAHKNTKLIYLIPNFQNPSGLTMSGEKRKAVYELAKRYNTLILEDNPYGETRFAGEDIPPIKSLDEDGIVVYAGSFSKVLSPGLRVGYAVAPTEIIAKMTVCKQVSDVHTNIWAQKICGAFMTECDYDAHIQKIKGIYRRKAELMMSLMDRYLMPKITYNPVQGGLFIWARLPEGTDMLEFCRQAVQKKVAVVPGSAFLSDESAPCRNIRLNFSTPTDEQMTEGMEILGKMAAEI